MVSYLVIALMAFVLGAIWFVCNSTLNQLNRIEELLINLQPDEVHVGAKLEERNGQNNQ